MTDRAIDKQGRKDVQNVIAEMQRRGYEFSTSVNFAREAKQGHERPTGGSYGDTADVLEIAGDPRNGTGAVTVKIMVTAYSGPFMPEQTSGERCYRYTFGKYRRTLAYRQVACPDRAPLVLPERTPDPELPQGADERLETALERLRAPDRRDVATVRAAVERAVRARGLTHDVAAAYGWIGVSVRGYRYTCLMARVSTARVEVWRPARVHLHEGEIGCPALPAAAGLAQRPPH